MISFLKGIQGEKKKRVLALILLRSNDGKNKSEMITLTIADLEEVRIWQGVAVGTSLCRCLKYQLIV